jgi:thioredoxin reductase (NADPH)
MVDVMYDVLIIGSGPAGCTAGIFSVRRNLKALVVSDPASLSQTEEATTIEDWPGDMGVHGIELAQKFRDHAKKLGVEFLEDKITDLKVGKSSVKIIGKKSYEGKKGRGRVLRQGCFLLC